MIRLFEFSKKLSENRTLDNQNIRSNLAKTCCLVFGSLNSKSAENKKKRLKKVNRG